MGGSIRTRMIVSMNLLVAAVGVAVGWVGVQVSSRAIEDRLTDQAAAKVAGLASRMPLALQSPDLMSKMGEILGAHIAAGRAGPRPIAAPPPDALSLPDDESRLLSPSSRPADDSPISASSLPKVQTAALAEAIRADPAVRRITLGGVRYRIGSAVSSPAGAGQVRVYLLVPEAEIIAAQRQAAWSIVWLTAGAILLATAIAFWLSMTIARPVRQLAQRMDRLAAAAGTVEGRSAKDEESAAPRSAAVLRPSSFEPRPSGRRHPAEIARLERSFDQLLARLGEARTQLARSARLATLGQLAASVAHELRNPLSGIKMNARVLADELKRAGIADPSLALIIREIDRMDLFLGELLSLSSSPGAGADSPSLRAGRSPGPVRFSTINLGDLAASVLALLAGRCRHAGVEVVRDFPPEPPSPIPGDEQQLRQAMLNLMLNALDAMPHGGRMTVAIGPGEPGRVRFSVADTGGGVNVPDGADIFDPFVTTRAGGTGLGLAICRQVIAHHGGQIGYDSAATGSTFWFELPNSAEPQAGPQAREQTDDATGPHPGR